MTHIQFADHGTNRLAQNLAIAHVWNVCVFVLPSWWGLVGGLEHFFIVPYIGNNHPNWLSYFSEGLKPPTRGHADEPLLCLSRAIHEVPPPTERRASSPFLPCNAGCVTLRLQWSSPENLMCVWVYLIGGLTTPLTNMKVTYGYWLVPIYGKTYMFQSTNHWLYLYIPCINLGLFSGVGVGLRCMFSLQWTKLKLAVSLSHQILLGICVKMWPCKKIIRQGLAVNGTIDKSYAEIQPQDPRPCRRHTAPSCWKKTIPSIGLLVTP